MKQKVVILGLLFVILMSLIPIGEIAVRTTLPDISSKVTEPRHVTSYTPSDPIVIESNADFETQGWPGEGTSEQPYLISGLNITTNGSCIDVQTTDVYFVIEDCLLISSNTAAFDTVRFWYVNNASIVNCTIECQYHVMLVDNCEKCQFINNIFLNCERGLHSTNIIDCSFIGNTCSNITSAPAFDINFSEDTEFIDNTVVDSYGAVSISHTPTNYLANNKANNCVMGFQIHFSPDSVLINNIASGFQGIAYSLHSSSNSSLEGNIACGISEDGIYLNDETNVQVIGNLISGATYCGISLGASHSVNNSVIQDNRIFSNYIGVYIFRGQHNTLYGNAFGEHISSAAVDNGEYNSWDDGVSEGNYWYDYSGEGVYHIKYEDAVDRYPRQMMIFDDPPDQTFESGLTGHSIIWAIEEPFPFEYSLYINDELNESGSWDGTEFEIPLDSLPSGLYNFTLFAINEIEINVTDTVQVRIWPSEAPVILSSPGHINVTIGTTRALVWTAEERSPASYHIYLNGTVYQEGEWFGSSVSITETWETTGCYNYTICLVDQIGYTTVDTVIVTVNKGDEGGSSAANIILIATIIVAVGLVTVVFVGVFVIRKR